jgi:predicted nucleotidyltransferase
VMGRFVVGVAMDRDAAIARLKEHEAELRRLGVQSLYLFGSTARDDARDDSDVDLFFDHPEGSLGLVGLMDVKEAAAQILDCGADIMTRRSLHPVLRDASNRRRNRSSDAAGRASCLINRHCRSNRTDPPRDG